jgi:cytochrome c oxidase subunit 3
MWLFLFSEVLLFGGLFLLYAVGLRRYPAEFHGGAQEMNVFFGGLNTGVLLTSSLSMALAVAALKKGAKGRASGLLLCTLVLACAFLVNKYLEWGEKIHHGLFPNAPGFLGRPQGEMLFFNLYYIMTGLHGLHVAIGAVVIGTAWFMIRAGRIHQEDPVILENCGLYWHLVDVIWIYLFPLFYLIT